MRKRLIISAILLPLLAFIVFFRNPWPMLALIVATLTFALNEAYVMLEKKKMASFKAIGFGFGIFVYLVAVMNWNPLLYLNGYALLIILLFSIVVLSRKIYDFPKIMHTVLPVMYISTLGVFSIYLRLMEYGLYWIFLLFLMTLVYDGGAYFAGSFFGKHKLIPEVSPGKTIEGCVGGAVINAIVSVIIMYTVLPKDILGTNTPAHIVILSVLISVFAQMGDLAESVFKRFAGVKNSSNLLPEMGGVLDKIDSMLFTAPVLFFYIKFVTRLF